MSDSQSEAPGDYVTDLKCPAPLTAAEKCSILQQPEMVNGAQLGQLLGLSRTSVDARRTTNHLVALEFGSKRGCRFPTWQVAAVLEHRVDFEATCIRLASLDPWERYRFFTRQHPVLGDYTGLQALLQSRLDITLEAADTWVRAFRVRDQRN